MGHTVGDQAARAVKKGAKKEAMELRTPEKRLSDIRSSVPAKLHVTLDDVDFLLKAYDAEREFSHKLAVEKVEQIAALRAELAGVSDQLAELQHVPPNSKNLLKDTIEQIAALRVELALAHSTIGEKNVELMMLRTQAALDRAPVNVYHGSI